MSLPVCDRVSLDMACLDLQVYQVHLERKVSQDQRETQDFLAALVHLDDLDLMVVQEQKVFYSCVTGLKNNKKGFTTLLMDSCY